MSGFYLNRRLATAALNEHDRLGTRNVEPPPATRVSAGQHVVNPDEIITRLLKSRPIHLVHSSRRLLFLSTFQPPDVVLRALATVGTTVRRFLDLFLFVEKIAFIHWIYSLLINRYRLGSHKVRANSENCKFPFRGRRSSESSARSDPPNSDLLSRARLKYSTRSAPARPSIR